MAVRRIGWLGLLGFAGWLSYAVTAHGVGSAAGIDLRFNPTLSFLYCALAILSFPVFLFALAFRKLAALQPIFAIAYLAVYSALNWRTCASLGDCGSVPETVLLTLRTHSALAFFAVAICSLAALVMDNKLPVRDSQK
jgi:hypothetical protein